MSNILWILGCYLEQTLQLHIAGDYITAQAKTQMCWERLGNIGGIFASTTIKTNADAQEGRLQILRILMLHAAGLGDAPSQCCI